MRITLILHLLAESCVHSVVMVYIVYGVKYQTLTITLNVIIILLQSAKGKKGKKGKKKDKGKEKKGKKKGKKGKGKGDEVVISACTVYMYSHRLCCVQ